MYTWLRNTARVEFNKVTNKITLKTNEPNVRVHLKYVVVAAVPVGCTRDIPRLIGIKNLSDKSVESRLVPGVVHPKKYKQATRIDRDSNEKKLRLKNPSNPKTFTAAWECIKSGTKATKAKKNRDSKFASLP